MFKERFFTFWVIILMLWISSPNICNATDGIVLRSSSETKESKQRVEKLEGELAELKRLLTAQQDRIKALEDEKPEIAPLELRKSGSTR